MVRVGQDGMQGDAGEPYEGFIGLLPVKAFPVLFGHLDFPEGMEGDDTSLVLVRSVEVRAFDARLVTSPADFKAFHDHVGTEYSCFHVCIIR